LVLLISPYDGFLYFMLKHGALKVYSNLTQNLVVIAGLHLSTLQIKKKMYTGMRSKKTCVCCFEYFYIVV